MKSVILLLTALHVLAHGVFGCCDHGVLVLTEADGHCVCNHVHHRHGEGAHESSQAPLFDEDCIEDGAPTRAPHECVHASCHWLTSDVAASSFLADGWMPLAAVAHLPGDPFLTQAAKFSPGTMAALSAAPPLRLHLALGVILA